MTRPTFALALLLGLLSAGASWPPAVLAGETARVVAGPAGDSRWPDLHLSLAWTHEERTAALRREVQGPVSPGRIGLQGDLRTRSARDLVDVRADAGVWRGVSLFLGAALVVRDQREIGFERGGCGGGSGACVDERSATILRDGVLPGFALPMFGLDAERGRPFEATSETVFRGPNRRGLEAVIVGAAWAVSDQTQQSWLPTWILRVEGRLALGPDRRFDPASPDGNHDAGLGYHQLLLSTVFTRRLAALEPHLSLGYALPAAKAGTPWTRYRLGSGAYGRPQHQAMLNAGVGYVAWENPRAQQRIDLELRGRLELRLHGLTQGDLWEPLSGSSACTTAAVACRAGVDRDLTGDGVADPHPGVTRSPGHGLFGGDAGLAVQVGPLVRFHGLFGLTWEQDRFLTDGRSGVDAIDGPGRRWRVEGARSWRLFVDGALMF